MTNDHREQAREPQYHFTPKQIARHLSETTDDYENNILQRGVQDNWMFASCARVYVGILLNVLSSRDAEIKEVLEGFLNSGVEFDDERIDYVVMQIDRRDLAAARELWEKVKDVD